MIECELAENCSNYSCAHIYPHDEVGNECAYTDKHCEWMGSMVRCVSTMKPANRERELKNIYYNRVLGVGNVYEG